MINPPEVKHTCKICGKAVKAFRRHQGKYYISSGIYPKYCKECSPYNKNKNEKKT